MAYRYLTPNLTGGVASKDILARVDLEKYATFLKQCKNGIVNLMAAYISVMALFILMN